MENQQVKFRGKTRAGKWLYGSLINNIFSDSKTKKAMTYIIDPDYIEDAVIPETVGQWTGLKDIDGKEVYDGDIIKSNIYPFYCEKKLNYVGIVEYDNNLAAWYYELKKVSNRVGGGSVGGMLQNIIPFDFNVIGNITDNSEILEIR